MSPYIVLGFSTVSWGVLSLGVSGPKAAMELGTKTLTISRSLADSKMLYVPFMLTSHANQGLLSPAAERIAAMWYIVSMS